MLTQILLFSMCCAAAYGSGQLSIVDAPKSLHFKHRPDAALPSSAVSELFAAALGLSVVGSADWPAFTVRDPFNPATVAVNLLVNEAADQTFGTLAYPLTGSDTQTSLATLFDRPLRVQHVELLRADKTAPAVKDADFVALKPQQNAAERKFVEQLHALAELAATLKTRAGDEVPLFVGVDVSFDLLAESSAAGQAEGRKLLADAVQTLSGELQQLFGGQALFTVTALEREVLVQKRQKRAPDSAPIPAPLPAPGPRPPAGSPGAPGPLPAAPAGAPAGAPAVPIPGAPAGPLKPFRPAFGDQKEQKFDASKWNVAEEYNEDYPVIFNIILWFGVVFVFSLVAISYAIGTMDPGRDSIIYRMTSTRMKKDN